jgi:hypothetical protein
MIVEIRECLTECAAEQNLRACASRIVNQAAMGSWTSPWLCDRQVMWDMSAHRVVDFPPASVGVLPSSEA